MDADGHDGCCSVDDLINFAAGLANAFGSDNLMGAGRVEQTTRAGKVGAVIGDGAAVIDGLQEATFGATGDVAGFLADLAPGGAPAGVLVNIASTGMVLHGTGTTLTAFANLSKAASAPNPHGSPGAPDHQTKVDQLVDKAKSEAKPEKQLNKIQK